MRWLMVLAVACHAAAPRSPPRDPAALAREILLDQLAAARRGDDAALRATFDSASIILASDAVRAVRLTSETWLHARPERVGALTDLVIRSDGNADAVWWIAQFAITVDHATTVYRVSEVATAETGWHVVAAGLATAVHDPWPEVDVERMEGATPPGELAALVGRGADERVAAHVIFADVAAETAVLADGRAAFLARISWRPFLRDQLREVSTGGIRFLQARLKNGTLLLLVAAQIDGDAKVVLAHIFSK